MPPISFLCRDVQSEDPLRFIKELHNCSWAKAQEILDKQLAAETGLRKRAAKKPVNKNSQQRDNSIRSKFQKSRR